jgi:3-oxoacyl-[acyl-carrier protein] reductase
MDLGISGKVALVTASSGGIGMNVARRLAMEGVNVVLLARSAEKLETLAATFRSEYGVRVLPVVGSMLDTSDHDRLLAAIEGEFGRLDIAVLNTGRPPSPLRAALDETDKSRWDQSYDTLLSCVIAISQRAYPLMAANGWGRMIAITSASTHMAMPHHALSTVFRAGVEAYMKHLSSEIGKDGITVNCVAPALIDSSHREATVSYTAEQIARRREISALKRLGTQEELASVVAFLASSPAGFVTGESIRVDGGMVTAALHR